MSLLQMVLRNVSGATLEPNFMGILECFGNEQLPQILHSWTDVNSARMGRERTKTECIGDPTFKNTSIPPS